MRHWPRSRNKRGPTEGESLGIDAARKAAVKSLKRLVRLHFLPSRSVMSSKKPLAIPAVSTIPSTMW